MSIIQTKLTVNQINEISAYVNNYRKLNQAPPINWDTNIQSFSQDWSYYLLENNLFEHSGTALYGENLAFFQGYGTDIMTTLKLAQQNISCVFPGVSNLTQSENIRTSRGSDNGVNIGILQQMFSYLFYGNSEFYDLPNVF